MNLNNQTTDNETGQKVARLGRAYLKAGGALWTDAWQTGSKRARVTNLRWHPAQQEMAVEKLGLGWDFLSRTQLIEIGEQVGVRVP